MQRVHREPLKAEQGIKQFGIALALFPQKIEPGPWSDMLRQERAGGSGLIGGRLLGDQTHILHRELSGMPGFQCRLTCAERNVCAC